MTDSTNSAAAVALQVIEAIRATNPELIADNMPSDWGMNKLREALKLNPTVHCFKGKPPREVYDQTQTDDSIKDGDVLSLGNGNVAILMKAWPTIVYGEIEDFHRLAPGQDFHSIDSGKYAASAAKARKLLEDYQAAQADKAFADYAFGKGVMVTDTSGWEYTSPGHERTRKVYVETEREDDGPAPRCTLNFTVRFDPATGTLEDACATDANGNQWGAMVGTSDITENVKVRMTLDVTYALNGENAVEMISRLRKMCERAIGEGMLTGETAAEVEEYSMDAVIPPEPLSEEQLSAFMLKRIENGQIHLGDIPVRLARYGLMERNAFMDEMRERMTSAENDQNA